MTMKSITTAFIFIIAISLLHSCYYDNEAYLYPATNQDLICPDTSTTYNTRLKPIIDNLCTDCHSTAGGESPDLTTYNLVFANKESIICRVIDSPVCGAVMPKGKTISACDKQAFTIWEINGFLE
jgi:hypothetical protein